MRGKEHPVYTQIRTYNKGGVVMQKQMELFNEGGLADEGGTVDPVSGNDVPVGSTQKEVRDDIPAQLSEGEFVLPADVVRYHGLEKIMQLRDEAKQGLQKMEDMGQMGNSDEAILDDDIPFSIEDLDMEDDGVLEYNQGGVVQPQGFTGISGYQPSQFANYQPQFTQYQAPQMTQPAYVPPTQQVVPTMQQQVVPKFEQFIATPTGAYDEMRTYTNPNTGETRQIPFVGGSPIYPIPEGFVYQDPEQVTTQDVTTTPTTVGTTQVTQQQGGGEEQVHDPVLFGKNKDTLKSDAYSSAVTSLAKHQLGSLAPAMAIASEIKNKFLGEGEKPQASSNDYAVAMNLTRNAFAKSLNKDISELDVSELDQLGTAMQAVEEVVRDVGPEILSEETVGDTGISRRQNMINSIIEFSKRDPAEEAAKIQAARDRQAERDRQALAAMEAREREAREAQERFYPQRDDNNDDRPTGGGTSFSDIKEQATREDRFGEAGRYMNKGGDVTKQMKKSGLASKK